MGKKKTHLSAGDDELDLTTVGAHQGREFVADTLEETQTVVLSKGVEEVLEDLSLVGAGDLLEFLDDLLLVGVGQGGGVQDRGELGVLLEGRAQRGQGLGGGLESRGLRGGSVLS